jgi:POT family proton-dependent oligopeptide transporter
MGKAGLIYKAAIPALAHQTLDGSITAENVSRLAELQAQMPGASVAAMDPAAFSSYYIENLSSSYNMGFAVACVSLVVSILIYLGCRSWFKHADVNAKQAAAGNAPVQELTPKQTKDRITALIMVFAVVIFFWMAFHQNGQSLTWFARDYTQAYATGATRLGFNIWALALIAASIYTLFGIFQSETGKGKFFSGVITAILWGGAYKLYTGMPDPFTIEPQLFQQFNPFYVVFLTPISMAIFSALAGKGKEPSAPVKIGLGMFVAALGYLIMVVGSIGQPSPAALQGTVAPDPVVPMYLISTYLVLTFAELLLSPMGISFVSKVAPPKYKGLMMGLWFAATAIGNYLSSIPGLLWNNVPLWANWAILMALCVIAGAIMFAMMKKINDATAS